MSLVVVAMIGLSWSGLLERQADQRLGAVLERALLTAAIARGLNGVISVAQGTEIAIQPIGVGVTITVGEILDPLNDLVERFSWLALVASASLGTQMLLTEISTEPLLSTILSVMAALYLVLLWWPGIPAAASGAMRVLAIALLVRFLFTMVSLTVGFVDTWVLEARQEAAMVELTAARDDIQAMQNDPVPPVPVDSSLVERFSALLDDGRQLLDLQAQLDALEIRAESAIGHILDLAVLFLVQTLLVPIGAFWLATGTFRWLWGWIRSG